jgi:hypothetical protein
MIDTGSAGSLTHRRNILGLCKYRASNVLDLFADIAYCLCASPFDSKLLLSFTMMDSDGDNKLTFSELAMLVQSHLRVIYACSETAAEKVDKCQLALSEIAESVCLEAVKALELGSNHSNGVKDTYRHQQLLSLEMVSPIAQDCMELADNVSGLSAGVRSSS